MDSDIDRERRALAVHQKSRSLFLNQNVYTSSLWTSHYINLFRAMVELPRYVARWACQPISGCVLRTLIILALMRSKIASFIRTNRKNPKSLLQVMPGRVSCSVDLATGMPRFCVQLGIVQYNRVITTVKRSKILVSFK